MTHKENIENKVTKLSKEIQELTRKRDNLNLELERKNLRMKNLVHTLENLPKEVGDKEIQGNHKDQN